MKKYSKKLIAVDLAEIALFVALMVAGAYVSIPLGPIPLTFQTVISVLSGMLLGAKRGAAAMFVYMFMGFICFIPVFSDHSLAGFAYALKPSFGYIIGFIAAAFTGGVIANGKNKYPLWRYVVAAIAAFAANYVIGMAYFAIIWNYLNGAELLGKVMVTYNLAYMPKDIVLCVLAAILAWKVAPIIYKGKVTINTQTQPEKSDNEQIDLEFSKDSDL